MWRPNRAAGAVYAAGLVAGTWAAVAAARRAAGRAAPLLDAAIVWVVLGGRSLERAAGELAAAVERGDLEHARRLAPTLVGRDPRGLDGRELTRAALESVAENTSDAVVAPLFWFAVGGAPAAAAYRAANTLDAMVGHRSDRYGQFGWAAARLDDALNWPAARLGAALTVVLAPHRRRAWETLRCDGAAHPSPNAGRMEAAFAGALGVCLGGSNRYGGIDERRPQLGAGPPPGAADVRRAVALSARVGLAAALVTAAAARRR